MKKALSFFSLFTSTATLLCCALPALLVVLGFGASFASFLGAFPQLIWFSENKLFVFIFSGICIALSYVAQRYTQSLDCPIDEKREACKTTKSSSKTIVLIASVLWLVGFSFAYLVPLLS